MLYHLDGTSNPQEEAGNGRDGEGSLTVPAQASPPSMRKSVLRPHMERRRGLKSPDDSRGPRATGPTFRVMLTGATGYVGGRLLAALESRAIRVRCLARRPERLLGRVCSTTEVVAGDLRDRGALAKALQGVQTAYYLV